MILVLMLTWYNMIWLHFDKHVQPPSLQPDFRRLIRVDPYFPVVNVDSSELYYRRLVSTFGLNFIELIR